MHRYYEAFNSNDRALMFECLHENVAHVINQGSIEYGISNFKQFMDHMDECYIEKLEEIVYYYDQDKHKGAAEFMVVGQYIKTDGNLPLARGQFYRIPAGAFFDFNEEHKITRITTYYNLKEWIEIVKQK